MWKLLHNGLPTDLAVKKKGISIVSKCCCCPNNPSYDFSNHLFLKLEIASVVWAFYMDLSGVEGYFLTINHALSTWWHTAKGNFLHSWLLRLVTSLRSWNIWKAKNLAIYEDICMNSVAIIFAVKSQIEDTYKACNLSLHNPKSLAAWANFFNIKLSIWKRKRSGYFGKDL